ncbi:serine/threonine-protein kinase MARK2-like isoform X2 [Saccostrea cucullata]|uniref:serine/threonine-protein kinase MARK2-like isoform X2 n=1 Tax=Saccostrea cuccullata TaxID=36930 RepID=UPI002ED27ECE
MRKEERIKAGIRLRGPSPTSKKNSIFENTHLDSKCVSADIVKKELYDHGYRSIKPVGEGAYAKVRLAEVMPSKLARNDVLANQAGDASVFLVAIKVIDKRTVAKDFMQKFLPRELENHSKLHPHKNVVRVYEIIHTHHNVYIVMEYCPNGDLLDLINQYIGENKKGIGEEMAKILFYQLSSAVQHIHNAGIVHRDLKCENILLGENNELKITDFGFSRNCNGRKTMLETSCGSYAYTAPEVIKKGSYDGFHSDVWSLGIILFAMVNGRLPFNDSQLQEMEEEMKMQRLRFERNISFDCMSLIRRLLRYSPRCRPSIREVHEDSWLISKKSNPQQLYHVKGGASHSVPQKIKQSTPKEHLGITPVPVQESHHACFKTTVSAKQPTVTGTVTLNHDAGETVTLKSRKHYNLKRPKTWPMTPKANTALLPHPKEASSRRQSKKVIHTHSDARQLVHTMLAKKLRQGEMTDNREFTKQIPLWLLKKLVESDREADYSEEITLTKGLANTDKLDVNKKQLSVKPFFGSKQPAYPFKRHPEKKVSCPDCTSDEKGASASDISSSTTGAVHKTPQNSHKIPQLPTQSSVLSSHAKRNNEICIENATGKTADDTVEFSRDCRNKTKLNKLSYPLGNEVSHSPTKSKPAGKLGRHRYIFLKSTKIDKSKSMALEASQYVNTPHLEKGAPNSPRPGNNQEYRKLSRKVTTDPTQEREEPAQVGINNNDRTVAEATKCNKGSLIGQYVKGINGELRCSFGKINASCRLIWNPNHSTSTRRSCAQGEKVTSNNTASLSSKPVASSVKHRTIIHCT